ncbi:PREDICTED: SLIT-ROBO Rho GTPase-activating protein 2-like, partial [Cyprinodon variegatus]|uniref:SLIT-ROBO Rho GTPase-activating protein 2-like n=2 Tax=Cyprinodon TaxID=28741 RepID=UPI0007428FF2
MLEERVSARGSAPSPTGGHVADIYLANLKLKKRPEHGNVRRAFRSESDGTGPGASSSGAGGARTASLPGGAQLKDFGDKRPVSVHNILNSVTRHSSLKTK